MPTHWTYAPCVSTAELEQGDILRPTQRLRAIFSEVHPHFQDDKYLGFLISTQSCDLVRRHDAPKASYINLAAIRPLSQVLHKVLSHVTTPLPQGVFQAELTRVVPGVVADDVRKLQNRLRNSGKFIKLFK
jgi:hypothetical protein